MSVSVDNININLLVLANLTINSKLYVRNGQFEIEADHMPWFITSVKRYIFGDGRDDIICNLYDMVQNIESIVVLNKVNSQKLLENLQKSLSGIQILKTCYQTDIRTVSRLQNIENLITEILNK